MEANGEEVGCLGMPERAMWRTGMARLRMLEAG